VHYLADINSSLNCLTAVSLAYALSDTALLNYSVSMTNECECLLVAYKARCIGEEFNPW